MARLSIQDIGDQLAAEEFVGRHRELDHFRSLRRVRPEDRRKFVLNIIGPSGVGKSELMHRMSLIAQQDGDRLSIAEDAGQSLVDLLSALADDLDPETRFRDLKQSVLQYRQHVALLANDSSTPEHVARFVGALVGRGSAMAVRHVAGASIDPSLDEAVGAQAGDLAAYLVRKLGSTDAAELVQDPAAVMGTHFVAGLEALDRIEQQAVVCIDAPEGALTESTSLFLQELLHGQYGDVSPNILLVVATQVPLQSLDIAWHSLNWLIDPIDLDPFSELEATEYLRLRGITAPDQVQSLIRVTDGMPVFLSFASSFPEMALSSSELAGTAAIWSLRGVESPAERELLLDLSLPRRLNRDIATAAAPGLGDSALDRLRELRVVRQRGDSWWFHAALRAQLVRARTSESPDRTAAVHSRLVAYFEELLKVAEERFSRDQVAEIRAELLYHQLSLNRAGYAKQAKKGFLGAFARGAATVRGWWKAVADAAHDIDDPLLSEVANVLGAIVDAMDGQRFRDAVDAFSVLVDDPGIASDRECLGDALHWRSHIRRLDDDSFGAVDDLTSAIACDPNRATYFAERAALYADGGSHRAAVGDYTQAIRLAKKPPSAWFLSRAEARIAVGQFTTAVTDATTALKTKRDASRALLIRGRAYRRAGRTSLAVADLRRAAADSSTAHAAYEELGGLHLKNQEVISATHEFEDALRTGAYCSECWKGLGRAIMATDETADMVAQLRAFEPFSPMTPTARAARARGMFHLGHAQDALAELNEVVADPEFDEDADWVYAYRGWAYEAVGDYGAAIADLEHVVALDQHDYIACTEAARIARLIGDFDRAVRILQAFDRGIADCKIFSSLARTYAEMGDCRSAIASWTDAVDCPPSGYFNERFLNERGLALSYLGRFEEAIALADEALADEEDSPNLTYNRAIWLTRAGGDAASVAVDAALAFVRDLEDSPVRTYANAGLDAVRGRVLDALAMLRQAAAADSEIVDWARHDVAWLDLRDHPEFLAIVAVRPA